MTAQETIHPTAPAPEIDASCRLPLLGLLVGASVWLVVGTLLALIGSLKFHMPEFLGACSAMTYGRVAAAANDALVYGFCIPASLAVIIWIFARLSQTVYTLPLVPLIAAHIYHLGVLIGLLSILLGNTTGYTWLEFPRGASIMLFVGFVLTAIPTAASFGFRRERDLFPSHWFLLAALLWFPWIYASANIFLVAMPVRGVAQGVINFWFANNLVFVWFSLVALGVGFYFLPKLTGRPLYSYFYTQYVFWTLALFGTWCGIPSGSPFPAWIIALSAYAGWLLVLPVVGVGIVLYGTLYGAGLKSGGDAGSARFIKVGLLAFMLSALAQHFVSANHHFGQLIEFTWFGQAQSQLQIFGVLAMVLFGALYYILPLVMDFELPLTSLPKAHYWLHLSGVLLFVIPLAYAGYAQGADAYNLDAALPGLRISTLGLLLLLSGSLAFAANMILTFLSWKVSVVVAILETVLAPLKNAEMKP